MFKTSERNEDIRRAFKMRVGRSWKRGWPTLWWKNTMDADFCQQDLNRMTRVTRWDGKIWFTWDLSGKWHRKV